MNFCTCKSRRGVLSGLGMVLGGLGGCANSTGGGAIGIDRPQFLGMVSAEKMIQMGESNYRATIESARRAGKLNSDLPATERVKKIAAHLIPHVAVFRPDAVGWRWEANVISEPTINAWCMPGGKIAFYTGIIRAMNMNDDEIAAVMGHEIAHALREHGRERLSQSLLAQSGTAILGTLLKGKVDNAEARMQAAYSAGLGLPFSRAHETEADRIGIELSARAGYHPRGGPSIWEKMGRLSSGGKEWASTHPSPARRMRDLEEYGAKVLPLYEAAKR